MPRSIGPRKGWLLIAGGGTLGPEICQRFNSLAGGSHGQLVLIPTAVPDNELTAEYMRELHPRYAELFGIRNVVVLHTRDRLQANSEDFVRPLRHASAVWMIGGRHWRLADAYLGTRTEQEFKAVLERGGVVGGTSAGATIQGSYMVRGASGNVSDPDGDNTILMSPGHEVGFGFLQKITIDQHVMVRHRENDLPKVIQVHPELLGIGIDEGTAIVVHGDEFEVIGISKVTIVDGEDHGGKGYYFLSRGQNFDLRRRVAK